MLAKRVRSEKVRPIEEIEKIIKEHQKKRKTTTAKEQFKQDTTVVQCKK